MKILFLWTIEKAEFIPNITCKYQLTFHSRKKYFFLP